MQINCLILLMLPTFVKYFLGTSLFIMVFTGVFICYLLFVSLK